jgi:hypothetical protein
VTGHNEQVTTQIPRARRSARATITVVPQFPPADPRATVTSDRGRPGAYSCTFVLSRPGAETYRSGIDIAAFMETGDSLLAVSQEVAGVSVTVTTAEGPRNVTLRANASRSIAACELEVHAADFADAETKCHEIVLPLLSWWSVRYDVGMDIAGYVIIEQTTGSQRVQVGLLGQVKLLADLRESFVSKPQFSEVFAAYREASNASNVFYGVLTYWRVIEGTYRLRDARRAAVELAGGTFRDPAERIPQSVASIVPASEAWLRASFAPHLGKKFTYVRDHYRPLLRNALAHLDPTGDRPALSPDRHADLIAAELALPILHHLARELLRSELRADADYRAVQLL